MKTAVRSWLTATLVLALALTGVAAQAAVPTPTPDPSYGTNGVATGDGQHRDRVVAVGAQSNGKIVQGLGERFGVEGDPRPLNRLNADGSLDTSFGDGGYVTGLSLSAENLAIAGDDSIYLVGSELTTNGLVYSVVKTDADGTLAPGFGDGGVLDLSSLLGESAGVSAIVVSQGVITLLATDVRESDKRRTAKVIRLDTNGAPIAGFGESGVATYDRVPAFAQALTVDSQNRPVVALSYQDGGNAVGPPEPVRLVRFSAAGVVDPAWGQAIPDLYYVTSLEAMPQGGFAAGGIKQFGELTSGPPDYETGIQWLGPNGGPVSWLPLDLPEPPGPRSDLSPYTPYSVTALSAGEVAFAVARAFQGASDDVKLWVGTASTSELATTDVSDQGLRLAAKFGAFSTVAVDGSGGIIVGGRMQQGDSAVWASGRYLTSAPDPKVESSITMKVDPVIPISGQATNFTVTVTTAEGPVTGGTVTLSAGGETLGDAQVSNGTAVITVTKDVPPGSYAVTAIYSGTDTVAGSTTTKNVDVVAEPTDWFSWWWYFVYSWLASFN